MTADEIVTTASNIGFAIATIKAFMVQPGVSSKQVHEALEKLDVALDLVSSQLEPQSNPGEKS